VVNCKDEEGTETTAGLVRRETFLDVAIERGLREKLTGSTGTPSRTGTLGFDLEASSLAGSKSI
jgi:hypothetical protein